MDVSIIGASGDCGRQIAIRLIEQRMLTPTERLQLVGRPDGNSAAVLHGLRSDLIDAYDEIAPELDVALCPEDVVGDIIVMAAGSTLPIAHGPALTRQDLASRNLPIFHAYASAIARYGHSDEIVIIVTNPVELGVEIFSHYLGRRRVIGIGAYSDTLRFRREIAASVGVRRQMVQAFVVGEHGDGLLPLWSSVHVYGMASEESAPILRRLHQGRPLAAYRDEVRHEKHVTQEWLRQGRIREAFAYVDRLPPDLRVVLKPYITHLSGAKTAAATANVTLDLVQTLLDGREIVVAGQVRLAGEFCDIHTSFGAPIIVSNQGWSQVVPLQLWEEEERVLRDAAAQMQDLIREWERHG